jgi:hypothetical protein
MKILVLQFEEHNGHYVFTPPMVENPVIITLPPEAEYVTIVREGNITRIYATDISVVEGWVVG